TSNTLGQLALSFADAFNAQHKAGFDANGDAGTDFFNIGSPTALSNSKNTSGTTLNPAVADSTKVQATDYKVAFTSTGWQVTRLSDKTAFNVTPDTPDGTLNLDGLKIGLARTPQINESFTGNPVSNAYVNMKLAI